MNSPSVGKQEAPSHLSQMKLVEFLESLHRIFKIGIYYPAGHAVLNQAAEQFQRNLTDVVDTRRSVVVELRGDSILVEQVEIQRLTRAVEEFRKLLNDLGIWTLEIDHGILLAELLQLVKCLLLGRSQLQGKKDFTMGELQDLPASVKIRQKEFMIDESSIIVGGGDDDDEGHGLNSVFEILAEQGFERAQIDQCKRFLNSLADKFSGRKLDLRGLPSVTWADVRKLLVKVVTSAYRRNEGGALVVQNDLNALSSIFAGLERQAEDRETKETISLLISVFGRFSPSQTQPAAGKDAGRLRDEVIPVMTIEQLQEFVGKNYVHASILERISLGDRCEELSILLQLLHGQPEEMVLDRIRKNLRSVLALGLSDREIELVANGLAALLNGGVTDTFEETLALVTVMLRSPSLPTSLQFLERLYRKIDPARLDAAWTVIVNELLMVGRNEKGEVFDRLAAIASSLPDEEMRRLWQRLEEMDVFQSKKMATDIFDPAARRSYRLFSFLLTTSMKKAISARVLDALRAHPPDWMIEAVAPLLQPLVPNHMKFLQAYLLLARKSNEVPSSMLAMAGNLVVQHLPELTDEQKGEPWVLKTIQAMPEMQVEQTRTVLNQIITEKRVMLMPKWPSACRKTANEAMARLKRRPLMA